jgi:hypothetical protein
MLVILAFHSEDQSRAFRLVNWICELGTVSLHQCLIVHDGLADMDGVTEMRNGLAGAFRHVVVMPLRDKGVGNDAKGFNLMFRRALRQVEHSQAGPFVLLTPDAVPLRQLWLDAIERAWQMMPRGKVFMGCHLAGSIPHMAAVGVYPQDAEKHAPNLVMAENNPFNLNAAPQIVPKMAATSLIVDSRFSPFAPESEGHTAVLWASSMDCLDGSLIDRLRDLGPDAVTPLPLLPPPQATQTERPGKFAVPEDPMTQDSAARRAASLAGSEGIPGDQLDTSTNIPRITPPVVSPLAQPSPALQSLHKREEQHRQGIADPHAVRAMPRAESGHDTILITTENVGEIVAGLAGFREKNAGSKAAVLAALRTHGFKITGRQKQKARAPR